MCKGRFGVPSFFPARPTGSTVFAGYSPGPPGLAYPRPPPALPLFSTSDVPCAFLGETARKRAFMEWDRSDR